MRSSIPPVPAMNAKATPPVGGTVRELRLAAGLTQEQLARVAGCSLSYIRLVEGGYRPSSAASSPKLRRLLDVLAICTADAPRDALDGAANG